MSYLNKIHTSEDSRAIAPALSPKPYLRALRVSLIVWSDSERPPEAIALRRATSAAFLRITGCHTDVS